MQVMHDNNITLCTALYHSSGFFIIIPTEGLHFSALVDFPEQIVVQCI